MIIVDTALERREAENNPVKVALIGAGFMARGFVNQVENATPGMRLVAICNRTEENARRAYHEAGVEGAVNVDNGQALDRVVSAGGYAVTQDFRAVCEAEFVDVIVEATGAVEYGAHVVMCAIENKKHVVLLNAEVDATVGPILARKAEEAGVVLTGFVKGHKLHSLLTNARCYCLPSSHEGLPIALLEAMSYHLPVVVSNIPANLEVGLSSDCYFHCGDVDALAARLQKVIDEDYHSVQYDMAPYDWDKIAKQVMGVYEGLLK